MFLSLETLTSIKRTDLPLLVEVIDLMNCVIISNDLTQMVNFPSFYFVSISSEMAFPLLANPDHVV